MNNLTLDCDTYNQRVNDSLLVTLHNGIQRFYESNQSEADAALKEIMLQFEKNANNFSIRIAKHMSVESKVNWSGYKVFFYIFYMLCLKGGYPVCVSVNDESLIMKCSTSKGFVMSKKEQNQLSHDTPNFSMFVAGYVGNATRVDMILDIIESVYEKFPSKVQETFDDAFYPTKQ